MALDFEDRLPIERLDTLARQVYTDMRLTGRTPIAVVGSGLSVPYGGISWKDATKEGLDEAVRQLIQARSQVNELDDSDSSKKRKLAQIARELRSALAFNIKISTTSDDLYLAMQIASDGIETARLCVKDKESLGPCFKDYMAKLFGEDGFRLKKQLLKRIGTLQHADVEPLDPKSIEQKFVDVTGINDIESFDGFLANFYSIKTLEIISNEQWQIDIVKKIKSKYKDHCMRSGESIDCSTLPPDRRSLVALILAARIGKEPSYKDKFINEFILHSDRSKLQHSCLRPIDDPIRNIYSKLGIRRFITLNYDLELESALMLDDVRAIKGGHYGFESAMLDQTIEADQASGTSDEERSSRVTRRFSDGISASSDIYEQSGAARLFEFGLNSADYRLQIVHQHGRADMPNTMVLTDEDLNGLYRHDRHSKTTLEQALDVVLTGNPILFIGLGLSEAEITRPLRQLVGEGRAAIDDPAFAIMAFDGAKSGDKYDDLGGVNGWRRQVGLLRQYGVHLLDAGHPRHQQHSDGGMFNSKLVALNGLITALKKLVEDQKDDDVGTQNQAEFLNSAIEFCEKSKVAFDIKLDDVAFKWMLDSFKNGNFIVKESNLYLIIDYLNYLYSKHYTQVLLQEIDRLKEIERAKFVESTFQDFDSDSLMRVKNEFVRESRATNFRRESIRHRVVDFFPNIDSRADDEFSRLSRILLQRLKVDGYSFLEGDFGAGKGTVVRDLVQKIQQANSTTPNPIEKTCFCYINCSMALEFDSAIFQLLRFVYHVSDDCGNIPLNDRLVNLSKALHKGPDRSRFSRPPVIILSGIERLLDSHSRPLTPELEIVMKILLHPNVISKGWHVLIVGTSDVLNWIGHGDGGPKKPIGEANIVRFEVQLGGQLCRLDNYVQGRIGIPKYIKEASALWKLFPLETYVPNGARSPASAKLIGFMLENWHIIGADSNFTRAHAELDRQILQNLAYVGQPVEYRVLGHMPDVRQAARVMQGDVNQIVLEASKRLIKAGLVMEITPFPLEGHDTSDETFRLALPRGVFAELRERFGVRSGEEQLSNSFTLTLAASMPIDLVIPDADISSKLSKSVGHLRAAWKDAVLSEAATDLIRTLRADAMQSGGTEKDLAPLLAETSAAVETVDMIERLACIAHVSTQETLRAATAIVRGFFSAATLVSVEPVKGSTKGAVYGQCEVHRKRLESLIERTREAPRIGQRIRSKLKPLCGKDNVKLENWTTKLEDKLASPKDRPDPYPALYSGELIWLLNEAGVISLVQGDLKAAEMHFREAENALVRFKGLGARHNWRRITINRAFLYIERGRIAEARAMLKKVEEAIKIPNLVVDKEKLSAEWDDKILSPIVTGYLGLVDTLGGHYESGARQFELAICDLIKTGQQRALALFYWRSGSLHYRMQDYEQARHYLNLAIAEAESGRQIDVVWRARLSLTRLQEESEPAMVATVFREARAYADAMDMPRLQVLALQYEAQWRMERDDLTVAAALTTQAMRHAARNGMTLMRISLRTLMGSILLRQGDASGRFLLERAIRHADRIGYQTQLNEARTTLLNARMTLP